jgi:hypothetical protein
MTTSGNLSVAGFVSAAHLTAVYICATNYLIAPTISGTNIHASNKVVVGNTVSASNIHATTKVHTPTLSATNIVATSVDTDIVFAISGQYGDELDSGFTPIFLLVDSPFTFTVNTFSRKLSAGAIVASVIIATSAAGTETTVTGLNALAVGTTKAITTATGSNIVSVGSALKFKLTGVAATDRNFSFTLKCTRSNFSGA